MKIRITKDNLIISGRKLHYDSIHDVISVSINWLGLPSYTIIVRGKNIIVQYSECEVMF